MIEIDHNVPPPPEPARPILASYLLAIEERQRIRFSYLGERIKTGCGEIDDYMLRGGLERGIIVGISAEAGEGRLISLHSLATILLSHLPPLTVSNLQPSHPQKTIATIIDTAGSFPISLLAKILKSRIEASRSKTSRQAVSSGNHAVNEGKIDDNHVDETNVGEEVQRCLEAVAISRVFDMEGLWEILGEVGRDSEDPSPGPEEGTDQEQHNEVGLEIIIIDGMTHLINELFARKERSEAHALLTSLSRTLHTLAHTKNILTILHNTTVTTKSYTADPSNPYLSRYQATSHKQPSQNPQPTSIFPSNPVKPALGQTFSQFPDLHLLMSQLPKKREDAETLYGQDEDEMDDGNGAGVGYCYVVEILKDETPNLGSGSEKENSENRFGGREQRWAAVDISPDGLGLVDAFMAKENMRVLGLEREKGKVQDVGSVAKIYGFGGRQV